MSIETKCIEPGEAITRFQILGNVTSCDRYGNGHINDTFLVCCDSGAQCRRYILQKINHEIFKNPEQLMENISRVTDFLAESIRKEGGDEERETLHIVPTAEGKSYYKDTFGSYWRVYDFIEHAACLEKVEHKEDFYESAYAFGSFQKRLSGFDASGLYETIPDFHNTPARFQAFEQAVEKDVCGRVAKVLPEIAFLRERKKDMEVCQQAYLQGKLPLRVTHNDTKLNNILFDKESRKGLCILDLDTVMPGLSVFDFGDSIRFGANTAAEDETDLTKVSLDLELFEQYVKGYLDACGEALTEEEIFLLPMGAKNMTMECGMRFLTDYLQGDTYFKIHREEHNLDRARDQLALVADMEKKWDAMCEIVAKAKQKDRKKATQIVV